MKKKAKIKAKGKKRGPKPKFATEEERLEHRRQYYRDYYAKNRDKILAQVKARKLADPEKRRAGQKRESDLLTAGLEGTLDDRVDRWAHRPNRTIFRRPRNPKRVKMGGTCVTVYSTGQLARAIGRSAGTVSAWLREGVIPGVTWMSRAPSGAPGISYFSYRFVMAVKAGIRSAFKLSGTPTLDQYRKHIKAALFAGGVKVRKRCPRKRK